VIVGVRERNEIDAIDVVCVPLVHVQRRAALLRGGEGNGLFYYDSVAQHCGGGGSKERVALLR
jgi:5-formyltetrahydrofolate cyclo-ligase